jgi:hypothetical protein
VRGDQVLFGHGGSQMGAGLCQRGFRLAPYLPRRLDRGAFRAGIAVEQQAVAARIDQPAIIVLAVEFDKEARQIAQQRDAHGLVVDPRPASPSAFRRRRMSSGSPASHAISASSSRAATPSGRTANSKVAVTLA